MSNSQSVRVTAAAEDTETVARIRRLSHLLDNAVRIPGTDYRIGFDPLVGLLPGVGDVPTTAAAAYIVVEAAALGVPRATLGRMVFNVTVDATVGSIPVVGDVFDAAWKANARNVRLLEARIDDPDQATADRRFLWLAGGLLFLGLLGISVAVFTGLLWLFQAVAGLSI